MKRCAGKPTRPVALGLVVLAWSSVAGAGAAPDEWRSPAYYAANGALSAALLGGNVLARLARAELQAGGDTVWFPGDAALRGRCSPAAAQLSDTTLLLAGALPPAMELGGGLGPRFVNAQLVYTQALLANTLLTSTTKLIFRRPRPFSYQATGCSFDSSDASGHLSFYSGHASLSFAAAFAGSFLMGERADAETSAAVWGLELALASATANLRARAGKHYYSDILVGALTGAGVGLAVPALHGSAAPPRGSDWLAALAGLVLGVAGSQLLALGAEAAGEPDEAETAALPVLGPLLVPGAHGLAASGSW